MKNGLTLILYFLLSKALMLKVNKLLEKKSNDYLDIAITVKKP